jgi:hypothetical protein
MFTLSNFTKILLLATFFLLFTGCNDDDETNFATPTQNTQNNTTQEDVTGLKSLTLTIDKTTLNKDENTTVKVMASYEDGSSKEITDKVAWVVTPESSVVVTKQILTAKKDNPTRLKAKLGNVLSNSISLDIAWVVNGHMLPPKPDKTLNDSTLLGVDMNGNGVRDDVERWIYETYKDKHPIYIDIAMQYGRAYKLVLEQYKKAKEIREVVNAPIHCNWYYKGYAQFFNELPLVTKIINSSIFSKYFNTKERKDIYWQYDVLLSGDSYDLPEVEKLKTYCDFNTSVYNGK